MKENDLLATCDTSDIFNILRMPLNGTDIFFFASYNICYKWYRLQNGHKKYTKLSKYNAITEHGNTV